MAQLRLCLSFAAIKYEICAVFQRQPQFDCLIHISSAQR